MASEPLSISFQKTLLEQIATPVELPAPSSGDWTMPVQAAAAIKKAPV
jgi:hypothetical protein